MKPWLCGGCRLVTGIEDIRYRVSPIGSKGAPDA